MNEQPERITGGVHVSTANEAAEEAGKPKLFADPVNDLRDHIMQFIDASNMNQHTRSMARTKADELVFWIKAGWGRA